MTVEAIKGINAASGIGGILGINGLSGVLVNNAIPIPAGALVFYDFSQIGQTEAITELVNRQSELITVRAGNVNAEQTISGTVVTYGSGEAALDIGTGDLIQGAATNLVVNSRLAGGGAAPTSWSQPVATGTSVSVVSSRISSINAYQQSAVSQRPFITQVSSTLSANTTYQFHIELESLSGVLQARDLINAVNVPAGTVLSFPSCEANPGGGGTSVVTTGQLCMQLAISATAGSADLRAGIGCNGNATGSVVFSSPQPEVGLISSFIITDGAAATRIADDSTISVDNFPATNFTLTFVFIFLGSNEANFRAFDHTLSTSQIRFFRDTVANRWVFRQDPAGAEIANGPVDTLNIGDVVTAEINVTSSGTTVTINSVSGALGASLTSVNWGESTSTLRLASDVSGGRAMNATIKSFLIK